MSFLSFHGAAEKVTGANFLLETDDIKILVDCGLDQDRKLCAECNYDDFPYDPKGIDVLFVTHAHLDHIGRIPKLVRDGFKGVIYSTPSTKEIATVMFEDGVRLLTTEARELEREPLYEEKDVRATLNLWKTISYHSAREFAPDYTAYFKDAGHIMGSAMIEITHVKTGKKIVFTGDLGNSPTPLLRDTEEVNDADYMVMESVYGNRNHESVPSERSERLHEVIQDTVDRGGVLLIPAFSIERTQIILYEINKLIENKIVPSIPVFLDSPLAIKMTAIYKRHVENFNKGIKEEITSGDDPFNFPKLQFTMTKEESKEINTQGGPKIIIAGSGMSYGGRILFHERVYLSNSKNTILFVGYQVPGTTGRQILDGNKVVDIFGKKVKVNARVEKIFGFSAHKGSDDLIAFVEPTAEKIQKMFVTMGEPKASLFLAQRLKDYLEVDAVVPKKGEVFEIEF